MDNIIYILSGIYIYIYIFFFSFNTSLRKYKPTVVGMTEKDMLT